VGSRRGKEIHKIKEEGETKVVHLYQRGGPLMKSKVAFWGKKGSGKQREAQRSSASLGKEGLRKSH